MGLALSQIELLLIFWSGDQTGDARLPGPDGEKVDKSGLISVSVKSEQSIRGMVQTDEAKIRDGVSGWGSE
jgi:hypothetical protein